MQFFTTVLLAALAALPTTTNACKCVDNGGDYNYDNTRRCCALSGGYYGIADCYADTISERLKDCCNCCQAFGSRTSECNCLQSASVLATDGMELVIE